MAARERTTTITKTTLSADVWDDLSYRWLRRQTNPCKEIVLGLYENCMLVPDYFVCVDEDFWSVVRSACDNLVEGNPHGKAVDVSYSALFFNACHERAWRMHEGSWGVE